MKAGSGACLIWKSMGKSLGRFDRTAPTIRYTWFCTVVPYLK
jgi:hypothetical protein